MRSDPPLPSRWTEWGAIAVALLAALALAATVLVARRELRRASETMVRGEGEALIARVHDGLRELREDGPPGEAMLASEVERLRPSGLRYLAVGPPGHMTSAGEKTIVAAAPVVGQVVIRGGRALLVVRMPLPAARRGRRGLSRFPGDPADHPPPDGGERPLLAIEFEPMVLGGMEAGMTRTVVVGAFSVVVLVAFASVLTRRLLQRAATERRAERERRLASLGEMSSVMAHEIRNPLASLKGNAQLLAERLAPGSADAQKAELVVREAVRLEHLTTDLLAFVRDGDLSREEVSPAALMDRALRDLARERVVLDLTAAPASLFVDEVRLAAAIGNLVRNALEAGAAGPPEAQQVHVRVAASGAEVQIDVRDHGPGIPEADEERIFEPFVTTRVHGTGLGLAVARRAIQQHGGTVRADAPAGGGALFRVVLPITSAAR